MPDKVLMFNFIYDYPAEIYGIWLCDVNFI